MFADAKTSAGAPCWICAASVFEPANEYLADESICGRTSVREAAAYTVICPWVEPAAPPARSSAAIATAVAASDRTLALDHHGGRLDDGRRRHAGADADLVDGVAGDDRDQADRIADDHLDLREQPVDLDVCDDALEPVAGAQLRSAGVA